MSAERHCSGAGVRRRSICICPSVRPSVNSGFSETAAWIQVIFCVWAAPCPPYLQTIFFCFQNSQFSKFFFSFSLTWDPMGATISKRYSSYNFHLIWAKLYENKLIMGGIKKFKRFGDLPKIKHFYGTLKFLSTQDHMGLEISKCYSPYSFDPIWAKRYDQ